ncbi:universal stress protein [Natrarchaeobius chitinivorans]|uniref:Universal stress protein n=1 Tax=Natrarchaeobius chitinivorans TaxID=1679083 RepID=A0A3N6MSI4_NATCH|nr:universal stress protein [Natrarchaeobius chitinivorans]RQG97706.1 universal stress protein [Natrarchaeobius chitinivorans]
MYRILVPVDTDLGRALHQAKHVARVANSGADIEATVLHVTPEWRQRRFSENDAAVEAVEHLEAEGVPVTRALEQGKVSQRIVEVADEREIHEIVMGGRKHSGVTMAVIGSIVQDVVLSADRPVTITGSTDSPAGETYQVLVPVDADEQRARRQANYVATLPTAPDAIAATILHVESEHTTRGFSDFDAAVTAADTLAEAGVPVERVTASGNVSEQILTHATDLNVNDIVMGGRKRSAVQKVVLGSISQEIVTSADRPVTITG